MTSFPALLVAIVLVSSTAHAQNDNAVNPLDVLGLSFKATASDVLHACTRAGLTLDRVDTGRVPGYFQITASGGTYRGHPATFRFGGGYVASGEEQAHGLRSVWAIVRSTASDSLPQAHAESIERLTATHGPATSTGTRRPEQYEKYGHAQEHFWRVDLGDDARLHVTLQASVDVPIDGAYLLATQYALFEP